MAIAGSIFAGFFLGIFIFSRVGRWFITLRDALRARADEDGSKPTVGGLLSIAILSSGPWLLVVTTVLAFYMRSEPWAVWVLTGFCGAMLFILVLFARVARKGSVSLAWIAFVRPRTKRSAILSTGVMVSIVETLVVTPHNAPPFMMVFTALVSFAVGCLLGLYLWEFRADQGPAPTTLTKPKGP